MESSNSTMISDSCWDESARDVTAPDACRPHLLPSSDQVFKVKRIWSCREDKNKVVRALNMIQWMYLSPGAACIHQALPLL